MARAAAISGNGLMPRKSFIHSIQRGCVERNIFPRSAPSIAPHRTIVFLLLHGEVGLQDLLQRFLLRSFVKLVVRGILLDWRGKRWLPGKFLDFVVRLGNAATSHNVSSPCLTSLLTIPHLGCLQLIQLVMVI